MKELFDFQSPFSAGLAAALVVALASLGGVSSAQTLPVQRPAQIKPGKSSEARISTGTVIMFRITKLLTSRNAKVGDTFEAKLDTEAEGPYQGLPENTMLEGHISFVSAKNVDTPGVLGLGFDRVRMSNGSRYLIKGVVIPIEDRNMSKIGKRWVAKSAGASRNYNSWALVQQVERWFHSRRMDTCCPQM